MAFRGRLQTSHYRGLLLLSCLLLRLNIDTSEGSNRPKGVHDRLLWCRYSEIKSQRTVSICSRWLLLLLLLLSPGLLNVIISESRH